VSSPLSFIAPPVTLNDGAGNVQAQFGPIFQYFVPARLTRTPTTTDQRVLFDALNQIEQLYDFSPSNNFEYAPRINPDSPMWMGFLDQQTDSSGPAAITTFAGNGSAHLTNATAGDYFGLGSIIHLSHDIEDLFQFYATPNQDSRHPDGEDAPERLMYVFRANQTGTSNGLSAPFNSTDPFTNGGCPAFVTNRFVSPNDATLDAQDGGGLFNPSSPPATQQTQTFTGVVGSVTSRRFSVRPGPVTARLCIFGWTVLVCPVWTFRRSRRFLVAPRLRRAVCSRSLSSRRSFRPRRSFGRCGSTLPLRAGVPRGVGCRREPGLGFCITPWPGFHVRSRIVKASFSALTTHDRT
jgi:hypothetical protein